MNLQSFLLGSVLNNKMILEISSFICLTEPVLKEILNICQYICHSNQFAILEGFLEDLKECKINTSDYSQADDGHKDHFIAHHSINLVVYPSESLDILSPLAQCARLLI